MYKYIPAIIFVLIFSAVLISCNEGYVSSDGSSLKRYLSPDSLRELTDSPRKDIWIIDVRPESAYLSKHIPTAKSFPSSTILERLNEIPKDQFLIVYCETGGRAQAVIKKLEEKGYTRMMNWGGYTRWKGKYSSGKPVQ